MPDSNAKENQVDQVDERKRSLLKKAAYVPPVLAGLTFLSSTRNASAQLNPPPIESAPNETNAVDEDEQLLEDLQGEQ